MNRIIFILLAVALSGALAIVGFKYVKPNTTTEVALGQGVIFKGIYTYGKGTQRDCTGLVDSETKENCERSNRTNNYEPKKARLISTTIVVKDINGKAEKQVYTDGRSELKIELSVGYHKLCVLYQGVEQCGGRDIRAGEYKDFGLPILSQ